MTLLAHENESAGSPQRGSRRFSFRRFTPFAAIALLVIVAFARCLWAQPIWDDEYLTIRNPNLGSWAGVRELVSTDIWSSSALHERSGYYRPVASLSFALNRLLFGNSSFSYHAWNVLFHAAVAVLLFAFVVRRKITTAPRAFAVVVLFATMPLVAEPVSWIAGRYDVLGAVFAMLALVLNEHRRRAASTAAMFALALSSKEPFAMVIGLVVLDDVLLLHRNLRDERVKYGALVGAAVVCFVLRRVVNVPQPTALLEQGGVGALLAAYAFTCKTLGALVVWPADLCFFHTYTPPAASVVIAVLLVLAASLVAASRARGGVLFGTIWCVVAVVPGALTAPTLRIIGDRYAYFPLIGAAVALAALIELVAARVPSARFAPVAILALASLQSIRLESRLAELQSPEAMFRATLARDPDNFTTLTLWGNVLVARRQYAEAEAVFLHAREVAPLVGDIDTGLSFVHLRQRRYAEAEADGRRAVAEKSNNPRAWLNLASALVDQGKAKEAIDTATEALHVRPRYAEAHFVRALAYAQLGDLANAREDLNAALAIDPAHAQARALFARIGEHP